MKRLSQLTFGQARVRGYTKREWERAINISKSLKSYYQSKQKKRIRQQVVFNAEYSQSVRAVQINGTATKEDLTRKIWEFFQSNNKLLNFQPEFVGYEKEEIADDEDSEMLDGVIYIEVNFAEIGFEEVYPV